MKRNTRKTSVSKGEIRNVAMLCGENNTPIHIDTTEKSISVDIPEWNRTYTASTKDGRDSRKEFLVLCALANVNLKKRR